jgi:hypothetical protein
MAGRPVPWASWDEWDVVRRQLFGATLADVSAGAVRVQAWRSRGRLPLGVDITERLLSMQLHDPSACAARGPPFSSCLSPLTDAALQAAYALTLVRFVNGISDASQKGRVAASVSHHASSAGLHPVLVEVRHAATHSHLPSLHLLRHAASHALSWLHDNYWLGQAKVLAHNRASVSELLSRLWANHRACSTNVTCDASPAAHCASDTNSSASEHSPRSTISSAAALKREEKSLLGSLKGMAQESRAQDIASVLMEHAGHILDMKSPNQSSGHSQSQGSPLNADSDSRDHAHIHASVLRLLEAHYPRVAPHIMLEATKRLVAVLKTLLQHLSAGLKGPAGLDVHACNALIALHAAARQVVAASKAYNTADLDRLRMHNRRTMQTCFMRPAGVPAASYSRTLASFWESAVTPQQTQTRRCAAALITFLDSLRCNPQVCQFRMLNPLLCTQLVRTFFSMQVRLLQCGLRKDCYVLAVVACIGLTVPI